MTKPVAGGSERTVHRKELLLPTIPLVVDADHQPERPLSPSSDVNDSESDSDDKLYFVSSHQNPVSAVVRPPPIRDIVPVTPPLLLPRRSRRLVEKTVDSVYVNNKIAGSRIVRSISVFMALSTVFHSINSSDNSPFSRSVLLDLFLPYWFFQIYISL